MHPYVSAEEVRVFRIRLSFYRIFLRKWVDTPAPMAIMVNARSIFRPILPVSAFLSSSFLVRILNWVDVCFELYVVALAWVYCVFCHQVSLFVYFLLPKHL